jgi:hypothetical protein
MLEAARENPFSLAPKDWCSDIYKVSSDKTRIGCICLNKFSSDKAKLDIEDGDYKMYPMRGQGIRFGLMSGTYLLENDGVIIAQYESTRPIGFIGFPGGSLINIEGKLTYDNRTFLLKTKSFWNQQFTLVENDQEVGSLHAQRKDYWRRKLIADLPDVIPIIIQVFLLWVLLCAWMVISGIQ